MLMCLTSTLPDSDCGSCSKWLCSLGKPQNLKFNVLKIKSATQCPEGGRNATDKIGELTGAILEELVIMAIILSGIRNLLIRMY